MKYVRLVFFTIFLLVISSCIVFADSPDDLLDSSGVVIDKIKETSEDDTVTVLSVKANPVTPQNSSGFHRVIINLLGNYEPVTVDYTYQTSSSYLQHSITTDPDWSWICSAGIFALVVFCVFRIIGGVIKNNG